LKKQQASNLGFNPERLPGCVHEPTCRDSGTHVSLMRAGRIKNEVPCPTAIEAIRMSESELLRDIGIYRASSHADSLNRNWTRDAYKALEAFSRTHWGAFTCEQLRAWANWIPDPPDKRAWGKPFQMAVKKGLIECIGYQPNVGPSRHKGICSVWRTK